jgi:hypothetical protein
MEDTPASEADWKERYAAIAEFFELARKARSRERPVLARGAIFETRAV